jgi:DNA-binding Lrp family transcriptional regulator
MIDQVDRNIINALQGGFPLTERPFRDAALALGLSETDLIARIARLLEAGVLTRFGPMYDVERMGGAFCLCALTAPSDRLDAIADAVNAFPEVAHNYERDHALNMWFVLAAETPERIAQVIAEIEQVTGCQVLALPKIREFFIGLRVAA